MNKPKHIAPDSMFFATEQDKIELEINKKPSMETNIENIFLLARIEQRHEPELTLDQITIAYHNVFTKPEQNANPTKKVRIKTKKCIAQKLFVMRQDTDNRKAIIELVKGKRGTYRLKHTEKTN